VGVDGTRLRSDGRVAEGVVQACRSAVRGGCVVVLATARPPRGVRSVRQTLDILSPLITYNGALIWNPRDEAAQHHEPIAADVAQRLIETARAVRPGMMITIESVDRWFTDHLDERFVERRGLTEPDGVGPLKEFLSEPVTTVNLIGEPGELDEATAAVRGQFTGPPRVAVFRPEAHQVQIAHHLSDKGIALQRIAKRLGVGRGAVMAVGDGINDMGMLEWAGFGVAMANAPQRVRNLADAVVPGNDDLGVARAVQRYVLGRG
jgi:Cof subfamily protein (haloacid dehalogenase superfamily)